MSSAHINYIHGENSHTVEGASAALAVLFSGGMPDSLLDVGCGTGTWLKAALQAGVTNVQGIDGVTVPADELLIPDQHFAQVDLRTSFDLRRRFAGVLCLEVAEHIEAPFAATLVESLTRHSDHVIFSAACPGQMGQHHVNCQWPVYWQGLFNQHGYTCSDDVRWLLWDHQAVEPWYRQNLFVATRRPETAGQEPRIRSVVHPMMIPHLIPKEVQEALAEQESNIIHGQMTVAWYLTLPFKALWSKLTRL